MNATLTNAQLHHPRAMEAVGVLNDSIPDMEKGVLAEYIRPIIVELMESLSFDNSPEAGYSPQAWDVELATTIAKLVDPSVLQGALQMHRFVDMARFAILTCRKHPVKFQCSMAHYVILTTIVDDAASRGEETFMKDMELFQVKMCSPEGYARLFPGRGPLHPVLENLITYMTTDQCPFFLKHPILHNLLIKTTLDFIAACQLEELHKGERLQLGTENKLYPEYLRDKNGVGEAFSLLVLAPLADELDELAFYNKVYTVVPDLNDFWCYFNDLFSLYKEFAQGETGNYIYNYAKVNGITLHDTVRQVFADATDAHKRIMRIADNSGSPKFKEYMQQLSQGYFLWHISIAKRYHLDEVLAEWFEGCFWA